MTNKELFVEYLKFNNVVPADFNQDDLPNWEMFNMEAPMSWEYGTMNPMSPMMPMSPYGDMTLYGDEMSQRMWNRPGWNRPGWNRPDWNRPDWRRPNRPGYNPFIPLFWWWLLF